MTRTMHPAAYRAGGHTELDALAEVDTLREALLDANDVAAKEAKRAGVLTALAVKTARFLRATKGVYADPTEHALIVELEAAGGGSR